jgi:hypothetical protein
MSARKLAELSVPNGVIAVTVPGRSGWHWRIVNGLGERVEESRGIFSTVARAVHDGRVRFAELRGVPVVRDPDVARIIRRRSERT